MGTNFYLVDKYLEQEQNKLQEEVKKLNEKYPEVKIVIEGSLEKRIHIAKTSAGWKPIFEANDNFKNIKELLNYYSSKSCVFIEDEYGKRYNWDEFLERVVNFNPKGKCHYTYCKYENYDVSDMYIDEFGNTWCRHEFS